MAKRNYLIVLEVATDEIRICSYPVGSVRPANDEGYRSAGPFPSAQSAREALARKSSSVKHQLYPDSFSLDCGPAAPINVQD